MVKSALSVDINKLSDKIGALEIGGLATLD